MEMSLEQGDIVKMIYILPCTVSFITISMFKTAINQGPFRVRAQAGRKKGGGALSYRQ